MHTNNCTYTYKRLYKMIQNEYRLDKNELFDNLREWNRFLKRKVHLIACGGTAMTLLGVKASTKDVDFMIPDIREYNYLTKQLPALGYKRTSGPGWKRVGEIFHFVLFIQRQQHSYDGIAELTPRRRPTHQTGRVFTSLYRYPERL